MSSRNHLSSKQLAGFVDTLVHQPGVNTWIKDVELAANKYFGMVVAPCALRYVIKKKFVFDGLMASGKICDPMNDQRKIWRKGFVLDCCLATTGHAGDGTDIHDGGGGSGSDGGGSDGGGSGGSDGGGSSGGKRAEKQQQTCFARFNQPTPRCSQPNVGLKLTTKRFTLTNASV